MKTIPQKRRPRDYTTKRAQRVLKRFRKLFKEHREPMTVNDVATHLGRTVRATRDWLNYMHEQGEIYVDHYEETTALRGKKLPAYRAKRLGQEQDAPKWWLDLDHQPIDESEGGHCD